MLSMDHTNLLLHLIQKLEIDIYDIPMQALTEQYMQYVHAMKQLEINIASEYLVLASELLMIKVELLLPQSTSDMDVDNSTTGRFSWAFNRISKL